MKPVFTDSPIDTKKNNFIEYFAKEYTKQRTGNRLDISRLADNPIIQKHDFDPKRIDAIIKNGSIVTNLKYDSSGNLDKKDIVRSELGEMLLTFYFEKKLGENERFHIPIKLIEVKEIAEMASRGIDAIGFRTEKDTIHLLLGEAKVSDESKNPPQVSSQIYDSQKKLTDKPTLLGKLGDFSKKLSGSDYETFIILIAYILYDKSDLYSITYGCTLVRDYECVDAVKDFGKIKDKTSEFLPHAVHFSILWFRDNSIENTVKSFFAQIQA